MDAAKKLEVLDWVLHLEDDTVFNKLLAIKQKHYNSNDAVAYTALGEPLNIEQYRTKAEKGLTDIKEGRYQTQEELENDIQSW